MRRPRSIAVASILSALGLAAISACGGSAFEGDGAGADGGGAGGTGGSAASAGAGGGANVCGDHSTCTKSEQCCHGRCITLDLPCEAELCGNVECGQNQYCCNASCSLCAPTGAGCPAIACTDAGPPVTCGNAVCAPGQTCCNASCSTCTWPGEACAGVECSDGGGVGVPCGPTECAPGEICCDPGCGGICGTSGGGCPDIYCPPECEPQDAIGVGPCAAFFGYAWTTNGCVGLGGCNCEGKDCDKLYASIEDCERAHETCPRFF